MIFSFSRKFTWIELVVCIAMLVIAFYFLTPKLNTIKDRDNSLRCRNSLKQLGIAMQLYVEARGGGSHYPPFNGAEFWTHMYRTEVMVDFQLYLCPETDDDNNEGRDLATGSSPLPRACSYGGRIHALGDPRRIYTGRDAQDTPIGCDDDEGDANHFEAVNVLFLDNSCREMLSPDPLLGGKRIGAGILSVCTN
ncbi:MAG: hypothetical protein AABZ60_13960 [Planctomycetota bacterium]